VDALPKVHVSQRDIEKNQNDSCSICLEQLSVGDFATRLPCGHLFHENCIKSWLRSGNQCPVCRYELATDSADYEEHRKKRMQQRKLRFSMSDLHAKGVRELLHLTDHLGITVTGCLIKSDLVNLLASSEMVEIIDEDPQKPTSPSNGTCNCCSAPRCPHLSKADLAQRIARLDEHAFGQAPAASSRPDEPGSVHDLASQILAELRQTAASLDFELDINLGVASSQTSRPPSSGGMDERRAAVGANQGCLTTAGQSIVHCSACNGGTKASPFNVSDNA